MVDGYWDFNQRRFITVTRHGKKQAVPLSPRKQKRTIASKVGVPKRLTFMEVESDERWTAKGLKHEYEINWYGDPVDGDGLQLIVDGIGVEYVGVDMPVKEETVQNIIDDLMFTANQIELGRRRLTDGVQN